MPELLAGGWTVIGGTRRSLRGDDTHKTHKHPNLENIVNSTETTIKDKIRNCRRADEGEVGELVIKWTFLTDNIIIGKV